MADYAVVDPASGSVIKEYPTIGDADLDDAVARAHAARGPWGRDTTVAERAAIIRRVGELHEERKRRARRDHRARDGQAGRAGASARSSSARPSTSTTPTTPRRSSPTSRSSCSTGDGTAVIRRSSVGVLLGIMPWNFPYYQVARFAGPNLVIGNTILLKHAPQCPESAAAMEQIFRRRRRSRPTPTSTSTPPTTRSPTLIADPRVQGVSLTGSERAGAAVAEIAGRNLKKVVLELGGSRPVRRCSAPTTSTPPSSPPSRRAWTTPARPATRPSASSSSTISTTSSSRSSPQASTAMAYGDPSADDTAIGPLSSAHGGRPARGAGAAGRGRRRDARRRRARGQLRLAPACSPDVTSGQPAPTARSSSARSRSGLQVGRRGRGRPLANDTPYGLGSYVFTTDPEQALRVADQIEAGMVFVNVRRRRRRRAALRRRQALGLRPRARPLRHRGVRQQEADPRQRLIRSTRRRESAAGRQDGPHPPGCGPSPSVDVPRRAAAAALVPSPVNG